MISENTIESNRDAKGRFVAGHPYRWQRGESGNPSGRTPATVYVREHLATMVNWTRQQVQAVIDDPDAPMGAKIAARRIIAADADGYDARASFEVVADRLEGRPRQTTDLNMEQVHVQRIVLHLENGEPVDMARMLPPVADDDAMTG